MASTPSSSFTQLWNYDVYLSFRHEVRKKFVDHLYTALQQRGILTYVDSEDLSHGAPIDVTLLKAIRESRIAIVVFSIHYAESSWCLTELTNIIKCRDERGQIVFPIYYHVDPSEVRHQIGEFGYGFSKLVLENITKAESWRKALTDASDIAGWDVGDNPNITESRCIEQVVDTVSNRLLPAKDLNGIGTHLHDLKVDGGDSLMASSHPFNYTPASSYKLGNHNVFLSFRREDTACTFVDHLYSALDQAEILTYKTEENFPFDESTNPLYLKVLEESLIAIIVFSKHYADSSWCLDELAYIMKCMHDRGKTVIPIFYDVSPSEIRKQKEAYGNDVFTEINKVQSWRKALVDASNLFGWKLGHTADGYESKAIKLIVDTIMKRLSPDKGLIGVRTRLEDFKYGGGDMATLASSHGQVERLKIPLQDILLATNNFSEANVIARGGFGKVYQGQSEQHGIIAIKRLDRRLGQGDPQFMMEIALLTICKHDNIVSLVGFCDQNGEKILVYKYESNGSLEKHLHRKDLTWIQRLHICIDAANGLKYLHDDLEHKHRIVHRDVKSSNILLDDNLKAKISDFGLSKIALVNVPCSVIISGACGTPGYVDPVYQDHNILTQKSDVYSFGVVLFEVLCGRLVNVRQYQDEHYFSARLAQNHYEMETLDEIIDSDLRGQINSDSLSTFSSIAYRCLKKRREERPTMSMVVDQLDKALDYQQGSSGFLHDVHISFRDRDADCHIVDDLCAALHQEGISTYKDNRTHFRKKSIILKAIERSRCFVIIFTKKFAVNSWYLDEVVKITECVKEKGQFVLPVFYNVSLNDVRTQKGYFGEVMAEYDTHPKMEVWTNALVEVTNSAGLEYSKFWCSADLVKRAVEEIKSGISVKVGQGVVFNFDHDL